jgi:hypothetical protein
MVTSARERLGLGARPMSSDEIDGTVLSAGRLPVTIPDGVLHPAQVEKAWRADLTGQGWHGPGVGCRRTDHGLTDSAT